MHGKVGLFRSTKKVWVGVKSLGPIRILAAFMALLFTASSSWAATCEISCGFQGLAGGDCQGSKVEDASMSTHSTGTDSMAAHSVEAQVEVAQSVQQPGCVTPIERGPGTLSASPPAAVITPTNMGVPCSSASGLVVLRRAPSSRWSISAPLVLAASSVSGSLPQGKISLLDISRQPASASAYSPLLSTLRI